MYSKGNPFVLKHQVSDISHIYYIIVIEAQGCPLFFIYYLWTITYKPFKSPSSNRGGGISVKKIEKGFKRLKKKPIINMMLSKIP